MALNPIKPRALPSSGTAKRTLAVSLAEEQLLLRLRGTKRKAMYVLFVGGDGQVKLCEELAALLDIPKLTAS